MAFLSKIMFNIIKCLRFYHSCLVILYNYKLKMVVQLPFAMRQMVLSLAVSCHPHPVLIMAKVRQMGFK